MPGNRLEGLAASGAAMQGRLHSLGGVARHPPFGDAARR